MRSGKLQCSTPLLGESAPLEPPQWPEPAHSSPHPWEREWAKGQGLARDLPGREGGRASEQLQRRRALGEPSQLCSLPPGAGWPAPPPPPTDPLNFSPGAVAGSVSWHLWRGGGGWASRRKLRGLACNPKKERAAYLGPGGAGGLARGQQQQQQGREGNRRGRPAEASPGAAGNPKASRRLAGPPFHRTTSQKPLRDESFLT